MSTVCDDEDWLALLALAQEVRQRVAAGGAASELRERRTYLREQVSRLRGRLRDSLARTLYLPLLERIVAGPLVLAQVGQSVDGRIATESGHSHYVNGAGGLDHLHRLRALVDAVVVGATTVRLDNPRLTTRRVAGRSPVRVVIDPHGRLPADHRCFDGAAPTVRVVATDVEPAEPIPSDAASLLTLPAEGGVIAPARILDALYRRGMQVVLIEGGGATVSAFLRASAIHRLHVIVAPMLIGPGRTAFQLPRLTRLDGAPRFTMQAHSLDPDVLLDCHLEDGGTLTDGG